MRIDITYQYPPELFQLLIETIPRLCPSKKNLLLFFRGAGVRRIDLEDIEAKVVQDRDSITKFEITRKVLQRLNERGEPALSERRELLKRVVEFEDFSTCWPNDELKAKGLVAEIRRVVNVKDSFTRIRMEREAERQKHIERKRKEAMQAEERRQKFESIKKELFDLFSADDPRARGLAAEDIFNNFFKFHGILVRQAFRRTMEETKGVIEQIDGVIELDGEIYLVEMKWLKDKIGVPDVSQHLVRVFTRNSSRGIFISATEPTDAALQTCKESLTKAVVFICSVQEIVMLLENQGDLTNFLRQKLQAAIIDKNPYLKIMSI